MACLQLGRIREGSYRQLMVRSGVRVRIACATETHHLPERKYLTEYHLAHGEQFSK